MLQTTEHIYIAVIYLYIKKNKYFYELVLSSLYKIIIYDNKVKLNIISITTDFECALMNAIKKFL